MSAYLYIQNFNWNKMHQMCSIFFSSCKIIGDFYFILLLCSFQGVYSICRTFRITEVINIIFKELGLLQICVYFSFVNDQDLYFAGLN